MNITNPKERIIVKKDTRLNIGRVLTYNEVWNAVDLARILDANVPRYWGEAFRYIKDNDIYLDLPAGSVLYIHKYCIRLNDTVERNSVVFSIKEHEDRRFKKKKFCVTLEKLRTLDLEIDFESNPQVQQPKEKPTVEEEDLSAI